ncbi:MAG: PQQ-binding-like beta-propeller repeat protein [Candidatus Thermoplasmatota archaeon]|nr:PQQ-binding-like beta-propeller repeat protein [Candidatus Thermoplasmatota archaeon]
MESSAVIDNDGIIYFGSFNNYLYAIYPDGILKWKYKTGGLIWSAPALADDGTIYVGSWDCRLHALYSNGTLKWKFSAGQVIASSPAIAPDGTIYFGVEGPGNNGRVWAVNPNGTAQWYYDTGYWIASDPAIGDDGTIYIGSADDYLYALNPNGTLKWRFKTGDWVKAHPAIASDGTVYISSFDGWLYALNPDNGSLVWKYIDGGDEASPAIGPDGIIYLGNSRLRALYPNGTLKWSVDLGPNIAHASPALSADGILYVAGGKVVIAVNAENGSKLWQKQLANDWVESSPIIGSDGTVYIGSSSHRLKSNGYYTSIGYLHAFGPVPSNTAPDPPVISGKPKGAASEPQIYGLRANDPQMNPVSFYIEWGDGSITEWSGGGKPPIVLDECASNETVYFEHTYAEKGTYTIRAKARDSLGAESDWTTLVVEMPVMHPYQYQGWQWLQSHFPLLARILNILL